MNCEAHKTEIVAAMASHESALCGELDQHVHECTRCRAFLANQTSVASAIDSHFRLIANGARASFVAASRARPSRAGNGSSSSRILRWQFAAVQPRWLSSCTAAVRMLRLG